MQITTHNWSQTYRNKFSLERDLEGIKYNGPGWYRGKADTVLILEEAGYLMAYVTNSPQGYEIFKQEVESILNLPQNIIQE